MRLPPYLTMASATQGLCGILLLGSAQSAVLPDDYAAAIVAAQGGQSAETILKLRRWLVEEPTNLRIIYDLATLLDHTADYQAALAYADQITKSNAPLYALQATAHSARMAGEWERADSVYAQILLRNPDDVDARAGRAYVLLGKNQTLAALNYVAAHLPIRANLYAKRDLPLLVVRAETYEQRKEWIDAALAYQAVLNVEPTFRYALRGRVFSLKNAGLAYLAQEQAERTPEQFDSIERLALAQTAGGFSIRYGEVQLATDDSANRFSSTDRAIGANQAISDEFGVANKTQFDRLVVLRDRQRMAETVNLYQSLLAAGVQVPTYASIAAADAYLFLKRPETARDLYVKALQNPEGADSQSILEWKISLMYAYVETEQHSLAARLATQTLKDGPTVLLKGIPSLELPDPDRTRVATLAALLDIYNDKLDESEKKLKLLSEQTPFNKDIRLARASLLSAREQPRAALREFQSVHIDYPDSIDAGLGAGEVFLVMNELATAKGIFLTQLAKQPDSIGVKNLEKQLRLYDAPVFNVEGRFGRGKNSAGQESVIDASLYSAPLTNSIGDHYRLFGHVTQVNGKVDQNSVRRTRSGVGIDYRARDVEAEVEINQSSDHQKSTGLGLKMTLDLSDQWHLSGVVDTNVADIPAAALRDQLTANSLKLSLSWTWNESRRANLELSTLHFSDGNTRQKMQFGWRERLLSDAVFKLDTGLTFSRSSNSLINRPYFNPVSDHEIVLDANAEWTTWRRYQRSFKQRLSASVGNYCQSGFDCGNSADVHYEHEWNRDDLIKLRYGLGRSLHPYDGRREFQNYLFFNLSGRVQ